MATTPAAAPPPESPYPHLPPELVEQILLNLPVKSLLRFTAVSTSWRSAITSPEFAAARRGGRKILVINDHPSLFDVGAAFSRPVSAPLEASPSLRACPFRAGARLAAFYDDMWCVVAEKRLHLWNPATGSHRHLPNPPRPLRELGCAAAPSSTDVVYGLGYDAVSEDYKLLKIFKVSCRYSREREKSLLYSLKSDSWKEIKSRLQGEFFPNCNGLFVNNALHWMAITRDYNYYGPNWPRYLSALISFDFSIEKFRVLEQPIYSPELNLGIDVLDVANLRSKLCVFVNYKRSYKDTKFVVWAMEDYDTWTKLYEIRYKDIPPIVSEFRSGTWFTLRPMYVYEDGRVLIWASSGYKKWSLILWKNRKVVGHSEIVAPPGSKVVPAVGCPSSRVRPGFIYVETFVSPTEWAPESGDGWN